VILSRVRSKAHRTLGFFAHVTYSIQLGALLTVRIALLLNKVFTLKTFQGLWRPLLVGLAVIFLYTPVLVRMASQFYSDPSYSYGFLIPFFSGYLVWLRRDRLAYVEKMPSFIGLGIVLCAIGLLYLGSIGAELFLTRISLVLVIIGLVFYFWGTASVRLLAFPLCFLFLMIPIPAIIYNRVVFPLQIVSSQFAMATLDTIKIVPALREGNLLILPHCTLEVVEACSGIRSLMSLVALALGYGYLTDRSLGVRAFLVIAMVPIGIVSNGFRVVLAAVLAYYKGSQSVDTFLHPISGLVIFLVAVLSLLAMHGTITCLRRRLRFNWSS
jgi:exosortase